MDLIKAALKIHAGLSMYVILHQRDSGWQNKSNKVTNAKPFIIIFNYRHHRLVTAITNNTQWMTCMGGWVSGEEGDVGIGCCDCCCRDSASLLMQPWLVAK